MGVMVMRIETIRVMRGPNYWSNYRQKVIVMKLDIEALEDLPTNLIVGFEERILLLMPSLIEHRCSKGHRGGFLERVREGTWMGHVVEHLALELQSMAGMDCGYGRTHSTSRPGVYHVVFAYEQEIAGVYAGHAALRIAEALIAGDHYRVDEDVARLEAICGEHSLGPSTQSIVDEARRRQIPVWEYDDGSLIVLGQGVRQQRIQATIASSTSQMAVVLACDKDATKQWLQRFGVPVPAGVVLRDEHELPGAVGTLGFPLVAKPIDGNHGRAVTTNITHMPKLQQAFAAARRIAGRVIIEKFITGDDYRFLVIDYKLVAVARRTPPVIVGDGAHTIRALIETINADPNRGSGHSKLLTYVALDEVTASILADQSYSLDTVLLPGTEVVLKKAANLSSGGTAADVTDLVHPENIFLAERIARLMQLDVCGIDVVALDVSRPITASSGAVIEVNAAPGFRMHLSPSQGQPINVAAPMMDMLFPTRRPPRIPVVAVAGTTGKTTTARLIAHLAAKAGHQVGYTTSDGIYVAGHLVERGDCTGGASAEKILTDPTVDFAVLECARDGILRAGLGFDHCNVSVITNVSDDHPGNGDIETLDDLAAVKEVVARSTFDHGYAVLNADDDRVYAMASHLACNIALYSLDDKKKRLERHRKKDGVCVTIEAGLVILYKGVLKTRMARVADLPLTFGGKAQCMVRNILAAVLVAVVQRFNLHDIQEGLRTFVPSPETTPGRMNLFHFPGFEVMVDHGHNCGGLREQKIFLDQVQAMVKVGVVAGVGDCRDEDIVTIGVLAAKMFDEVIIRMDKDLRGRTADEMEALLRTGIRKIDARKEVTVIHDEVQAVMYALAHAQKGAFIMIFADDVTATIDCVQQMLAQTPQESSPSDSPAEVKIY